ncbi:type VI secretion system tube protein Hcp [Burkholderia sp. S171]|jgi:type VI secretion system secreted protein Hcp|uniref:Hcp family type VI secretion system effector n=1 Tax=Burkholderia sp. S171 TaxID=1641860 RepID=UPI00131CA852|nr:type VI secretion system tube protein Hcp [Burkholderia sp. S171]
MDTILLSIKDIKGNALIDGYADQIVIHSFSHAVSLPMGMDATNTERTLGRPNFQEFSFSKSTDQATPGLFAACAQGTKLGDATLSIGRNENGKFMLHMKYVLTNSMVSSIGTSGGGEMGDTFSLNFTQMTSEYTQQNIDSTKKGNASFGWDLSKNVAVAPAA